VTRAELEALVSAQTPESEILELKREPPGKSGRPDPWMAGEDRLAESARDAIAREIVGLANSSGGRLLLGVDESESKPARAARVHPIPRCELLAERLGQQLSAIIDPQIPSMKVTAIPIEGAAGVVVIDVGVSGLAPHRHTPSKECFVRRGTRTEPMTMREVQDLTLLRFIGQQPGRTEIDRLAGDWSRRATQHYNAHPGLGFSARTTVVPTRGTPRIEHLRGRTEWQGLVTETRVANSDTEHLLAWPIYGMNEMPCLGGIRQFVTGEWTVERRIHRNGSIQVEMHCLLRGNGTTVYSDWIICSLTSGLWAWEGFKRLAGVSAIEAAIECEVRPLGGPSALAVFAGAERYLNRSYPIPSDGILVTGHVYSSLEEVPSLVYHVAQDLHNATGADLVPLSYQLRALGTHRFAQ
jgi:hypothetical protein